MPLATGKLSICTANTKAATSPARGACFSSRVSAARRAQTTIPPAATAPAASEVPALTNPSGMCTDHTSSIES